LSRTELAVRNWRRGFARFPATRLRVRWRAPIQCLLGEPGSCQPLGRALVQLQGCPPLRAAGWSKMTIAPSPAATGGSRTTASRS